MHSEATSHQAIKVPSDPPILSMARRLEALHGESGTLDVFDFGTEIAALEAEIMANPATSLNEAAVQVMLASAYVERLREDLVDDTEAALRDLQRLMRSVLSAFIRETGLDLAEFGANRYLPGNSEAQKDTRFCN